MNANSALKTAKFFLYLVPFTLVIVYQESLFPFIVGKYFFFRTVVGLALIFFAWGVAVADQKPKIYNQPQKAKGKDLPVVDRKLLTNPLFIAVSLFVFIFLLAGFFGVNPSASFWSNFERGEGGLQILTLFVFFALLLFLFRSEDSWRRMFLASLWAAAFAIIYGLAGWAQVKGIIENSVCARFPGSLGNPAYLGTYMIFAIFYSLYLSLDQNKRFKRWGFVALAIIFFVFLLLSQTRGALLGLGIAVLAALLYLFFAVDSRNLKIIFISLFALLAAGGWVAFQNRRHIDLMPWCGAQGGNRIIDIDTTGETFQTRLVLWRQTFEAWKERPLLGWGPENFNIAFEKYYDIRHIAWFDRAHNIFFDYLVFGGAALFLSFIGIWAVFYWQFFKTRTRADLIQACIDRQENKRGRDNLSMINYKSLIQRTLLFVLPVAYLVQGLVLFDVLPIYINIFLFMAFATYKFGE